MSKYNLVCPSGAPFAPSPRLLFSAWWIVVCSTCGPPRSLLCAASIHDALDLGTLTCQTFRLEMFHQSFLRQVFGLHSGQHGGGAGSDRDHGHGDVFLFI